MRFPKATFFLSSARSCLLIFTLISLSKTSELVCEDCAPLQRNRSIVPVDIRPVPLINKGAHGSFKPPGSAHCALADFFLALPRARMFKEQQSTILFFPSQAHRKSSSNPFTAPFQRINSNENSRLFNMRRSFIGPGLFLLRRFCGRKLKLS